MKDYIKKIKIPILIQVIFTFLYSLKVALFPVLNKYLFDNIKDRGMSLVFKLIGLYLILIILNLIFQYISRLYEWKVSKKFLTLIKDDLFNHISSMDSYEFNKRKVSDYLVIFNENVEIIDEDYLSAYIDFYKNIVNILVFLSTLLIFVDTRISIVVLLTSIVIVFIPKIFKKRLISLRTDQITALKKYYEKVLDLLAGKSRINKFNLRQIKKEHKKVLLDSEDKRYEFGRMKTISDLSAALGVYIVNINTFIVVAILLAKGEISIGVGVAAFGYTTSFLDPIQNLLSCRNLINSTSGLVDETLEFLDSDLIIEEPYKDIDPVDNLSVKNLSLKFNNFSLDDFSYDFKKNKKYAITGHSGSGKSTLINIIDGSIRPDSGKIEIDGRDINQIDIEDYIFSLKQFEHLFSTSFQNNISIFESMDSDIPTVSKFLNSLSEKMRKSITGYDSIKNLSGGEKQVVALSRMLVANRPIILLDEPYSNIDYKTSQIIKDYLYANLDNKILIEITHDLTKENLSRFDEIIYLEDGKIVY